MKKTNLNDCVELIKTPKIKEFVKKALGSINKRFFVAPASSSGKYHPPENQGKGGLIVHTRKVVQVAISLFRFFEVNHQLTQDKIIAACILHDICKSGKEWASKHTVPDHGKQAKEWLLSLGEYDKDIEAITDLVENHMAIWSKPYRTPALKRGKKLSNVDICHLIVQLSDYFSARKWAPFIVNDYMEA